MKARGIVSKLIICAVLVGSWANVMGQEIVLKETSKKGGYIKYTGKRYDS